MKLQGKAVPGGWRDKLEGEMDPYGGYICAICSLECEHECDW